MLRPSPGGGEEMARELEQMRSKLTDIRNMAYDENVYRGPMGLGILLAVIFLFIYGLIYLAAL
jgi:hypothetical protein